MWTEKNKKKKKSKLSAEILGLLAAALAVSLFFFAFLNLFTQDIATTYLLEKNIELTEIQNMTMTLWIQSISLLASAVMFLVLFLFLLGQKLSYLRKIIDGVYVLRAHRMDFVMPVEGNNEFTELAKSINYLSETERQLQQREAALREERETLIRALSHDIRTPLTTILSYSEYIQQREEMSREEINEHLALMQKKAEQIKILTDRLLEGRDRSPEWIEHGKLLVEQLAEEWTETLEESFLCTADLTDCPPFSGEFDVQELRRIFDNLASNIEKYADAEKNVDLRISRKDDCLLICQKNSCRPAPYGVQSYKIGLENIRQIVRNYGGNTEVQLTEDDFCIGITLPVHFL